MVFSHLRRTRPPAGVVAGCTGVPDGCPCAVAGVAFMGGATVPGGWSTAEEAVPAMCLSDFSRIFSIFHVFLIIFQLI